MTRRARLTLAIALALTACGSDGGAADAAVDAAPPDPPDAAPPQPDADLFPDDQPIIDGMAGGLFADVPFFQWFELTSPGGQWIVVEVAVDGFDHNYQAVVMWLYDATGALMVKSVVAVHRFDQPSVLRAYLAEPGAYYIGVDGVGIDSGTPFTLTVRPPAVPSEYLDPETGDTTADAVVVAGEPGVFGMSAFLLGMYDHAGDSDSFAVPIVMPYLFRLDLLQGAPYTVALFDPAGELYAQVNLADHPRGGIGPPMPMAPGSWTARFEGVSGATTAYLAAAHVFEEAFPPLLGMEVEDPASPGTNDTSYTAEECALTSVLDDTGIYVDGFAMAGRLSTSDDVDMCDFWFGASIDIIIVCEGASWGSGARGLRVDVMDELGTTVASAGETDGRARIPQQTLPAGRHVVAVSKSGQDSGVPADYFRCRMPISF
jgi:hypothetical protein